MFGLAPLVRPSLTSRGGGHEYVTYCKREYEGEIFHLTQTLDYWSLPVLAMGKVSQWAVNGAVYVADGEDHIPFIVNAPPADAVLSSLKARKKFEVIAEGFAEKVKKWRSANLSSPTRMAKDRPVAKASKARKKK